MTAVGPGAKPAAKGIDAIYPLSPLQHGILYHCLVSPGLGYYVQQLTYRLEGELDARALKRAWESTIERHQALRSAFVWEGRDQPLQAVKSEVELPWELHDWSDAPPGAVGERLARFLEDDARRGFDLLRPPLLRIALISLGSGRHQVVFTYHHLLMDGWSTALVQQEVTALYRAYRQGRTVDLGPVRPYRDYIAWLKEQDQGQAERYWRDTLRGFEQPTPLVIDTPGGDGARDADGIHREVGVQLPGELADELQAFARTHHLTLNTVVQGAWSVLLSRYSGHDDVVFGTTVSGRPPDLEGGHDIVGLFINTLPVRVRVDGREPLVPWLQELQRTQAVLRQYEHSALSQVHRWSEVPQDRPLFESLLVFENFPVRESPGEGGRDRADLTIHDAFATERPDVPLLLAVVPGRRVRLKGFFDRRRFQVSAVRRVLGHLERLLRTVVSAPGRRLEELAVLTPSERHQLRLEWNDSLVARGDRPTVHRLVERSAAASPDRVALSFEGVQLSYAELQRRAGLLARLLRSHGVRPGVQVGVLAERSIELVVALLGVLGAGGAYVPLDPDYPAERLDRMIEQSEPSVVLVQGRLAPPRAARGSTLVRLDGAWEELVAGQGSLPPTEDASEDDLAYVIYTSGSTGRPKGVMVPHRGVSNRLQWMPEALRLGPDDAVVQKTPYSFDVSVWELFWPLVHGARLVVARPGGHRDSRYLVDLLARERVTVAHFVPSMLGAFLDEPALESRAAPSRVIASGEALSPEYRDRFVARLGSDLFNLYGPTEASIEVTWWPCGDGGDRVVPIGRPIDNVRIQIADRSLRLCPAGVPGELLIGGECLVRGYLGSPALTAQSFVPDPFGHAPGGRLYRSGDLARHAADGAVEFLGRFDGQVKVRGNRIELGEIETVLAGHPAVREARVVAWSAGGKSQRLVAYAVPSGAATLSPDALDRVLREHVTAALPGYMVPSVVMPLERLPLTPSGKLDRGALPEPSGARAADAERIAPRSPEEKALATIWREVLGVEDLGVTDNFFGVGGDSILGLQVVARAHRQGLRLTPRQLFESPTIEGLALLAERVDAAERSDESVVGAVPLTPVQRWFFEQELPDLHHFNQALMLRVEGRLEHSALAGALAAVVAHHDALRFRFQQRGGEWIQEAVPPGAPPPLTRIDLSHLGEGARRPSIEAAADQLQRSLDLENGTLLRVGCFDLGPSGAPRLLLVAHHLVIDGVSWRVVLEDLAGALERTRRGEAVELPAKSSSFKRWAEHLVELAGSEAIVAELDDWRRRIESVRAFELPVDFPGGKNLQRSARTHSAWLGRDETAALLREPARAYRARVDEVLLAALTRVLGAWAGSEGILVELEGHGRDQLVEGLDLSRTVGWFTTMAPVAVAAPAEDRPDAWIKSVKEQIRGIPHRGLGYGLLRYLAPRDDVRAALRELPRPEVVFNFLGRIEGGGEADRRFSLAEESTGASQSRRGVRRHRLEIQGGIYDGALRIDWVYGADLHRTATVEALATGFMDTLRELVDHCRAKEARGYTPSDFPLADLDQQGVDALAARAPAEIEDIYPLSPMQEGMLFHTLMAPGSGIFVTQAVWRLEGRLDPEALEEAWADLVQRHPILRTGFFWTRAETPLQVVFSRLRPRVRFEDLRSLDAGSRSRSVRTALARDREEGFDLQQPPLTRLSLFRVGDGSYRVAWSHHHVLLDGWSVPLLLNDLLRCYAARRPGDRPGGAELARRRPYRDYIEWLARRDPGRSEAFWRRYLEGFDSPTRLALGREAEESGGADAIVQERLSRSATQALERMARRHNLTVGTVAQGAWALVVSLVSGRRDVAFGTPVSGRPGDLAGSETMIGLLINTVPVRARIRDEEPILYFLHRLQSQQARVREHEHTPLSEIQRWSELPRGEALFDNLLVIENFPVADVDPGADAELRIVAAEVREQSNYPFAMEVRQGDELILKAKYESARFTEEEARRIAVSMADLLRSIVDRPDGRIGDLETPTEATSASAVDAFNESLELES